MIKRIGLYRFLTTFCIVPTYDWVAFGQRLWDIIQKLLIFRFILIVGGFLFNVFKTPLLLWTIFLALTYFPDVISWIFITIGDIQMRCFALVLSAVMPDVFGAGSADMRSWADIYQNALNLLPDEIVQICDGLGVSALLGMITSTITSGFLIKIYRAVMKRAGML